MEIEEIVMKLVGPVTSCGEHNIDTKRLENLKKLCDVTDHLIEEIRDAALTADNHQASMKEIGVFARDYLRNIGE